MITLIKATRYTVSEETIGIQIPSLLMKNYLKYILTQIHFKNIL